MAENITYNKQLLVRVLEETNNELQAIADERRLKKAQVAREALAFYADLYRGNTGDILKRYPFLAAHLNLDKTLAG